MPSIDDLTTTTARNAKINEFFFFKKTNVSNLVKKNWLYNTKINEIEKKLLFKMIMINILLVNNFISWQRKILLQD